MAILLREQDVDQLLDMPTALNCVERAFIELGEGRATNLPRSRVHQRHGSLAVMPAGLPAFGVIGFKAYTWFTAGARFMVNLYSAETGELLALIEADRLGQIRTGAASGVATKWMAREEAETVGIFGSGYQAESQLRAICSVRKIKHVLVHSRRRGPLEAFCGKMEKILETKVQPAPTAKTLVEKSEILVTATTSKEPLFDGDWLNPGAHINAIGGNSLIRAEVDTTTILRSQNIVVDSKDQAKVEAGEFLKALEMGWLYWERIEELGRVVVGRVKGRKSPEEITYFKSLGIAVEDLAVGSKVLERAMERKIGERI